ncbi:MAG: hypothetical protein KA473_10680 [Anaerolineales bacterium]|nr:hypothetical protein [Anaerolineales bacterium]MBP6209889.1 hypothetical protein [Anaerolineales bacterium]MBP8164841.1 hypothetical protein [Anaerolineales bacterium]
MNNKNTGMIATIATALICGCCGLFTCVMGIGTISGNGSFTLGDSTQATPPAFGYAFLCLSVIMIIIPIAVGFFTMRKKPEAPASNEPLPPAS